MAATFTASGLASGLDTNSIIDSLVKIESAPITRLQKQQAALRSQVSALGQIMSALTGLASAARDLGSNGALASKVTSSNASFSASAGTTAQSGRYTVQVDQLATAAKWRSGAFADGTSPVAGGTITLSVNGTTYDPITVTPGESLTDVAYALRNPTVAGVPVAPPVSATILTGKDGAYLSVTTKSTGFDASKGVTGDTALVVGFTASGAGGGTDPGFGKVSGASNAQFSVDGLSYERPSNTVADAIPGVTLSLTKGPVAPATTGTPEDLLVETDTAGTQARLQKLVDAYNGVMSLVQRQLAVTKDTDRASTLAGDPALRSLQAKLQALLVQKVPGLGTVRSLADLGVKTAKDGSLSLDASVLTAAVGRDPGAVNALFSTATTGLAAAFQGLVDGQTSVATGVLTLDQRGLNDRISAIDGQTATMQRRVDAFRDNLVAQFTAMEQTISNLKSSGTFLTSALSSSSSK